MSGRNRNISANSEIVSGSNSWKDADYDKLFSREDSVLFETFGENAKGWLDIEEVKNDPSLSAIDNTVKAMISDYRGDSSKHTDDKKFVRDSLTRGNRKKKIQDEISDIKIEIDKSGINELSAEWVKEWHEKKKLEAGKGSKSKEKRDFITSSLETDKSEPETIPGIKESNRIKRALLSRYISLSAAAVIGAFILIRTLLPSSDPKKLYDSYYKPFDLISSVTRSGAAGNPDDFSSAAEHYGLADYQTAAAGFSNVLNNDTSVIAPRFYMGITQIALGNFNQAISLLSSVAVRPGEYHKEALWYLGLAYLKTGEKVKAANCFDLLRQSPGFYSERSGDILRRLK
jgi:TolA-binding protein